MYFPVTRTFGNIFGGVSKPNELPTEAVFWASCARLNVLVEILFKRDYDA